MMIGAFGMWLTMHITPQTDYPSFVLMRIFQVLGLPLLFVPVSTLAFADIPKEKSSKASALYALSRNLGGSIGISLLANYVFRQQQFHQQNLSEHMTPLNKPFRDTVASYADQLFAYGHTMASATAAATGHLYREMMHQASILAFDDAFRLMSVVMATLVIVALSMPHNNPNAKAAPGAGH
jgi:DHA2 family multidrug resistance protein